MYQKTQPLNKLHLRTHPTVKTLIEVFKIKLVRDNIIIIKADKGGAVVIQ